MNEMKIESDAQDLSSTGKQIQRQFCLEVKLTRCQAFRFTLLKVAQHADKPPLLGNKKHQKQAMHLSKRSRKLGGLDQCSVPHDWRSVVNQRERVMMANKEAWSMLVRIASDILDSLGLKVSYLDNHELSSSASSC